MRRREAFAAGRGKASNEHLRGRELLQLPRCKLLYLKGQGAASPLRVFFLLRFSFARAKEK